ncbi:MAG: AI-2E family transporter [Thermodesulfobacteriota bacterium]
MQARDPIQPGQHESLPDGEPRRGWFHPERADFQQRVMIAVGISAAVVLLGVLVWAVGHVLLLFAGVLLAVALHSLSAWVREYTSLSDGWALTVVVAGLLLCMGLGTWLLAPRLADQFDQLTQQLPRSALQVKQYLAQYSWGQWLLAQTPQPRQLLTDGTGLVAQATGLFSSLFGVVAGVLLVLFTGLFLAAEPQLYTDGLLRLVPLRKRQRPHEVMQRMGHALRWWLVGQVCSMAIVSILTILGLWLLNMQLVLTLGLLAGLFEFIPKVGPILAAVPAILLAVLQSPTHALYVLLLYVGIQTAESYFIYPLIQEHAVSLPPALVIAALVLLGVLAGFLAEDIRLKVLLSLRRLLTPAAGE